MKRALQYRVGEPFDEVTKKLLEKIKERLQNTDDDFRLLITGETGSGKSFLMLHIYEYVSREEATVDCIGTNPETYAQAMRQADLLKKRMKNPVFCVNDEANIFSTETMSKYNKAVQRVMAQNRAAGFFHVWCMPNPGSLQAAFLDEVFDLIIVVLDKHSDKPRRFAVYDRERINKMRDLGNGRKRKLDLPFLIEKNRQKRLYLGCFIDYKGHLRKPYLEKKMRKISDTIEEFYDEYGKGETYSLIKAAKILDVAPNTLRKYVKVAIDNRLVNPPSPTGHHKLSKNDLEELRMMLLEGGVS